MLFSCNDVSMKTKAHSYFVNVIEHKVKIQRSLLYFYENVVKLKYFGHDIMNQNYSQ